MGIGTTEIIFILVIVLLLFGAKKLPELARSMGTGLKEFKNSMREINEPIDDAKKEIKETANVIKNESENINKEVKK